jgi:hypothetical protein
MNCKAKYKTKMSDWAGRTVRGNIDWTQIWTKLKKIKVTNKVKEFQWKCLHNINYTIFNLSGDIVVFDSFRNCSLSLIFKVTQRSGTIVVSPYESNTTISPDKLKIKVIQGIFKQNINQN